jgi:hypothetical protein
MEQDRDDLSKNQAQNYDAGQVVPQPAVCQRSAIKDKTLCIACLNPAVYYPAKKIQRSINVYQCQ